MATRGRKPIPTEDLEKIADDIEMHLKEGRSLRESCLKLGIRYRTVCGWEAKYPWFKERIDDALDYCQGWWEGVGRSNIDNKNFNPALYFMHMRNRFGWSNSDNTFRHEHSGNIIIEVVKFGSKTNEGKNDG